MSWRSPKSKRRWSLNRKCLFFCEVSITKCWFIEQEKDNSFFFKYLQQSKGIDKVERLCTYESMSNYFAKLIYHFPWTYLETKTEILIIYEYLQLLTSLNLLTHVSKLLCSYSICMMEGQASLSLIYLTVFISQNYDWTWP